MSQLVKRARTIGVETEQDDTAEWRVFQYPYLLQLIASFNGWRELKSLLLVCKSSGLFRLWLNDTAFKAETLKMVPSLTPVLDDAYECTIDFYDQNWRLARTETVSIHTADAQFNKRIDLETHLVVTEFNKDESQWRHYSWRSVFYNTHGTRREERSYRPEGGTNVELMGGLHFFVDEKPFVEKNSPFMPKLWNEYRVKGYLTSL